VNGDDPWLQIRTDVLALRQDAHLGTFSSLLDKLLTFVEAKPRPMSAEQMRVVVDLVRGMRQRLHEGASPNEVLSEAKKGDVRFDQPSWDVNTVNQAKTIFQFVLNESQPDIQTSAPEPTVPVPVVLVAMTAIQVQDLISGAAFENSSQALQGDFDALREFLEEAAPDWALRYGDQAADWRPFQADQAEPTIEELVSRAIQLLNDAEGYHPSLAPWIIDVDVLNDNRLLLRDLRRDGCVVIIDSISMRHPGFQHAFFGCLLDAYPKTSVVTVAPTSQAFDKARDLTVVLRLRLADLEFAKRRIDMFDEWGASVETTDRGDLAKWLGDRVRKLGLGSAASTSILSHMRIKA
jgi:hypothetical protein